MTRLKVVYDTNIVVSANLKPGSLPAFPFSVFGKTRIVSPAEFALVVAKELSAQARKP